jgi:hypothetical protein
MKAEDGHPERETVRGSNLSMKKKMKKYLTRFKSSGTIVPMM